MVEVIAAFIMGAAAGAWGEYAVATWERRRRRAHRCQSCNGRGLWHHVGDALNCPRCKGTGRAPA